MSRDTLTGSRIRERRQIVGLKQADLARRVGVSPSYLNLIEHNRRRIGGKLLADIAETLGVDHAMLSEGAEAALVATLREAAVEAGPIAVETDRAEEFAGRFPGWAEVLGAAHRRILALERTVETLSDRLAHDPNLAGSLHEVLSTAAAIRSTASILAEPGEIEPAWRDRFHRNLNEDSQRLADSSKALVEYLDEHDGAEDRRTAPREEVDLFMETAGYRFPTLEQPGGSIDAVVQDARHLTSRAAREIAAAVLEGYVEDAAAMPLDRCAEAIDELGLDPAGMAQRFGVPLHTVLRRLAVLPPDIVGCEIGLVICDPAGTILVRKQVAGFAMPRFGAPCPLWPLFSALSRPHHPIRRRVVQQGRDAVRFDCLSLSYPALNVDFDHDPLWHAIMLILPEQAVPLPREGSQRLGEVGSTCRICSRRSCPARREPSILDEGF
ncbi:MAG: short-chain fatty acyl-CoA regulator family protein [Marinibacterium sp.]|nr:short-chain fatty acyl-CoA regulator family protein [Marinibacterium sp.]